MAYNDPVPMPEPLRVALVADELCLAQLTAVVRHLCVGLFDEAVRVTLICPEGALPVGFTVGPTNILTYPSRRWSLGWRRAEAIMEQFAEPPMLVHALSASAYRLAHRLAGIPNVPLVVSVIDEAQANDTRLGAASHEHLTAPSAPLLQRVRHNLGIAPDRCVLIRPGLHVARTDGGFAKPERIPAIMAAGRLKRHSGLRHLIRALRQVIKNGRQAMLFIIGAGPGESELRMLAKQLDIGPYITFAGDLSVPLAAVRGGDIFVQPTRATAMSDLPLAVMGAGLAVVATTDSVLDFLIHDQTALLYPENDENALAEHLQRLIDDPADARRLADGAHDHIKRHHAVSGMVRATCRLYDKLTLPNRTIRFMPTT